MVLCEFLKAHIIIVRNWTKKEMHRRFNDNRFKVVSKIALYLEF